MRAGALTLCFDIVRAALNTRNSSTSEGSSSSAPDQQPDRDRAQRRRPGAAASCAVRSGSDQDTATGPPPSPPRPTPRPRPPPPARTGPGAARSAAGRPSPPAADSTTNGQPSSRMPAHSCGASSADDHEAGRRRARRPRAPTPPPGGGSVVRELLVAAEPGLDREVDGGEVRAHRRARGRPPRSTAARSRRSTGPAVHVAARVDPDPPRGERGAATSRAPPASRATRSRTRASSAAATAPPSPYARNANAAPRNTIPAIAMLNGTYSATPSAANAGGNAAKSAVTTKISQTWFASQTGPIASAINAALAVRARGRGRAGPTPRRRSPRRRAGCRA